MNNTITWKVGDTVSFCEEYRGETLRVFAGLFFYHGLGLGYYYGTGGKVIWAWLSEVHKLAVADGLTEYTTVDSFDPNCRVTQKITRPVMDYVI